MLELTVSDLPEGARITVRCGICERATSICVEGLKRRSPGTTITRVKERARCDRCGSNAAKRPEMVFVEMA